MKFKSLDLQRYSLIAAGSLLGAFLLLPLVSLGIGQSPGDILLHLQHPQVAPALRLSLWTTTVSLSLVVFFGTPLAWILSQAKGRVSTVLEVLLQLPMVIPPAVAGIALLLAFGRFGRFAGILYPSELSVVFTPTAVIFAQTFVSAPFFIQASVRAFRSVDRETLWVARSFGTQPARLLWRVAIPLAAPGLIAGAAMSWARALGEFGATLLFAGNLEGRTQTLPLAVYAAMDSNLQVAQTLSLLLMGIGFLILLTVRITLGWDRNDQETTA